MSVTEALLSPLLTRGAPRPLITHYDEAVGGRVELSRATVANWAAKTANWLTEELDVEPGTPVAVRLPAHWQTAGILLGAWWCGARVVHSPSAAEAAFVPGDRIAEGEGSGATVAVALDALGGSVSCLDEDVVDFASEVRIRGDEFTPLIPVSGDTPALLDSTVDEVVRAARERAETLGIGGNDRVLSALDWTLPHGVLDGLLAVLAAGASLVQLSGLDDADSGVLDKRRADERTTVELGLD
ncbi:TIGR03089 family protein [Actinopolyspora mortivallis]|uniref:TIGR03089 family protein n=1 Tax=Actinopolyspora mortivallis TaxID=33906 RepID=A0A2T0GU84_ACTMO|nr:TIGR03089 family protein [Actinopolyspora mortivallis]PRW62654.1 TIGR03089 family protein [Actinopolyspora mortivallis]